MEQDIKKALREHRGSQSVTSVALNALLAYPDRPFGFGDLIGREFDPETQRREPFLIAATRDLDEDFLHPAASQPALMEDRTALERQCQILLLRRHHAGSVFEADGEEAVGLTGDGREVRN